MNNDGGKFPDLSGAASLAIKLRTLAVSSKFSRVLEFPIVSVHLVLIFFTVKYRIVKLVHTSWTRSVECVGNKLKICVS